MTKKTHALFSSPRGMNTCEQCPHCGESGSISIEDSVLEFNSDYIELHISYWCFNCSEASRQQIKATVGSVLFNNVEL